MGQFYNNYPVENTPKECTQVYTACIRMYINEFEFEYTTN